jgi:hypothetical protein
LAVEERFGVEVELVVEGAFAVHEGVEVVAVHEMSLTWSWVG